MPAGVLAAYKGISIEWENSAAGEGNAGCVVGAMRDSLLCSLDTGGLALAYSAMSRLVLYSAMEDPHTTLYANLQGVALVNVNELAHHSTCLSKHEKDKEDTDQHHALCYTIYKHELCLIRACLTARRTISKACTAQNT
eukprot:scaffold33952_cov26-Tisochrysis_lutea.AAC.1